MDDLAARTEAMAAFIAEEQARTKACHVIGLGYSNGANILAAVALAHPHLVDDLILMHPLIPWSPAAQPGLMGRRALVTAGRHDPICPASMTEALVSYLAEQGTETSLVWHPGGHEIRESESEAIAGFLEKERA